jgi:hypothetical protein
MILRYRLRVEVGLAERVGVDATARATSRRPSAKRPLLEPEEAQD